jgi:ribosome biogenesis protein NSA1
MKVIVGDEFGVLKCLDVKKKQLDSKYGEISKNNSVVAINPLFDDDRNILSVAYEKKFQLLNWANKKFLYQAESSTISSIVKHTVDFNSIVLANSSSLEILRFKNDLSYEPPNPEIYDLSIKSLQKIANSSVTQDVFLLYKDTPVSIFDLENKKLTWRAKNLPNDELDLKVPIYDVDLAQTKNPNVFFTATGYGEIRKYDRGVNSKRPVCNKQIYNRKINRIVLTHDDNYLIVGDVLGNIFLLDHRKSNRKLNQILL